MDLNPLDAVIDRVLARHPGIRLATVEDNQKILAFYDASPISGRTVRIRSVRRPDFFKLLRYQSAEYRVLICEDQGQLKGVATVLLRPGYIRGEEGTVAYLGDFRVGFDRRTARAWRSCYSELIRELSIPSITAVIDENLKAQNAFVRQKRSDFIYEVLTPYKMVNVLGRIPRLGPDPTAEGYFVRRGSKADLEPLRRFLDRQNRRKAFGYAFGSGELERRLEAWEDLKPESFWLAARAGSTEIAGCLATWSPAQAKVNVVEHIPWYFQLSRPLVNVPRRGSALNAVYLTHLELEHALPREERGAVFRTLFDALYRGGGLSSSKKVNMVSFADFPGLDLAGTLRGYLLQRIPMTLFTVRHRDAAPLVLSPAERAEPGFEIALV